MSELRNIMTRRRISMNPVAENAAVLFGTQIRLARRAKRWTAAELADRAGVSRITVLNAEAGSPSVSIGNVFNMAALAGVNLFEIDDPAELARVRRRGEEHLALLPSRVDKLKGGVGDDGDYDF